MLVLASQSSSGSSIFATISVALVSGVVASLLTGVFTLVNSSKTRSNETKIARMKTVSELVYENEIENLKELKKYAIGLVNDINEFTYRPSDPVELMKFAGDPKKYNQRVKVLERNIQEDIAMVDFALSATTNNKFKNEILSDADKLLEISKRILSIEDEEKSHSAQVKLRKEYKIFLTSVRNYINEQLKLLPKMINDFE